MRPPDSPAEHPIRERPEANNFPVLTPAELEQRCEAERTNWPAWRWELEMRLRGEWVEILRGRVGR